MKTIPKAKADLFRVLFLLREWARLEHSLVTDYAARRIWGEVADWAEGSARSAGLDLDHSILPGEAIPETAKRRREAAGSTRKGERTRDGAPGTTAGRLAELDAKIHAGSGLNMAERAERQGLIFNHTGKTSRPAVKR